MTSRALLRRALYTLAWLAPAWALITMVTGGVGWMIGPIRLSSRQPWRLALVGLVAAVYYVARFSRDEMHADAGLLDRPLRRALPLIPAVVVLLGLFVGIHYGSFVAAGSDSYGYVSQADLWLHGNLHIEQPIVGKMSWGGRGYTFAPLGYRPLWPERGTIVPTYPPGLPMLMAVFLGVFGSNGPFLVVPVLGALALWLTYLLGVEVTQSRSVGACAAVLLLASPVFLAHLMLPMTDVPVAAGWTLVCWLALKEPRPRALAAGLATGATLLIRPNLLLIAGAPVIAWLWPCLRGRGDMRAALKDTLWFSLGILPAVAVVLVLNTRLYGSPLASGYGNLGDMYKLAAAPQNFVNYFSWLITSQTVLVALAAVSFFVPQALRANERRSSARACLAALFALTLLSYLFYYVFDGWLYLRYLLPALPAVFVLMAAGIRVAALKLPVPVRMPAAMLSSLACATLAFGFAYDQSIFNQRAFERRHIRAAEYVSQLTPPNAVILAVQHSGSIRYYAHRVTLRYDAINQQQLDATLRELNEKGYRPYIVVDDGEETEFRNRFAKVSRVGRLDWRPLARIATSPEVHIYDPEGRANP